MLISILFSSILICCASPVKEITGYVQVEQKITKKRANLNERQSK